MSKGITSHPSRTIEEHDVRVKSWVTAARAEFDPHGVARGVGWLAAAWPFQKPQYAART